MIVSKYFNVDGKDYVQAADYDKVLYELKSAKEKIVKLEKRALPNESIKVADLIIHNFKQGIFPIYEKDGKGNIKYMDIEGEKYALETGMYRNYEEVRQIAEHLLVYCNHNSEDSEP